MRAFLALSILLCSMLGSGGALLTYCTNALDGMVRESVDGVRERARNRRWAEAAWEQVCSTNPQYAGSEDFARGFKDGFADYLYFGGNAEPPVLPPSRYRSFRYQTPQGYRAIEDWYAGYREGATVARVRGYRRWITGPTSLSGENGAGNLIGEVPDKMGIQGPEKGTSIFSAAEKKNVPFSRAAGPRLRPRWAMDKPSVSGNQDLSGNEGPPVDGGTNRQSGKRNTFEEGPADTSGPARGEHIADQIGPDLKPVPKSEPRPSIEIIRVTEAPAPSPQPLSPVAGERGRGEENGPATSDMPKVKITDVSSAAGDITPSDDIHLDVPP